MNIYLDIAFNCAIVKVVFSYISALLCLHGCLSLDRYVLNARCHKQGYCSSIFSHC